MSVTFSRTGVAYQRNASGIWESVATGVMRTGHYVNGSPMTRLDPARTNRFWNSDAPATQTQSIPAGTYCLWVEGSGSITLSGGPTGTATEGNPVVFTLASTTSVTFTVSGSLTVAQCENGKAPSSFILTAGANVARGSERLSVALPDSVVRDATFYGDLYELGDSGFGNDGIFHVGLSTTATPYWRVETGTTSNTLRGRFHDGTTQQNTSATQGFVFADHIEVLAWLDTATGRHFLTMYKNGVPGTTVQSPIFTEPANYSGAVLNFGPTDLSNGLAMAMQGMAFIEGIQDIDTMRLLSTPVVDGSARGTGTPVKTLSPFADGEAASEASAGCTPELPLHRNHLQLRRRTRCQRHRCCTDN